jgi:DNA polymerase-4
MSADDVDATLVGLVDRVAKRLRDAGRVCRTVVLRLRFADFARCARSRTLLRPTDRTELLLTALRRLLDEMREEIEQRGLTLLGVTLANLDRASTYQLELPFRPAGARELDAATDAVRARFGTAAIGRAVLVGRSVDETIPILSD